MNLYQRLIEDFWFQQISKKFALILTVLLCRERLFSYIVNDIVQFIWKNYLTNFDVILNDQNINNKRTIFKQMIFAFVRVLYNFNISEKTIRFFAKIFNKETSFLKSLNDVANQYCVRKFREHNHNKIFEKI